MDATPEPKPEPAAPPPQKPEPRGESRHHALSQDELLRLETAARSPRERLYIRLMARWGLRNGECAHFCLAWVSGQRGVLQVPLMCRCPACVASGQPWRPKRKASERALPIAKHTETWEATKIFFERFPAHEDQQVSERAVLKLVHRVADRAGLTLDRRVFAHALRATAATQFAAMGANELQLCRAMGWDDLRSAKPYLKTSGAIVSDFLEGKDLKWW